MNVYKMKVRVHAGWDEHPLEVLHYSVPVFSSTVGEAPDVAARREVEALCAEGA